MRGGRTPVFDPTLGQRVENANRGSPPHRLVAIGDSITHGFQSGSVLNTDLAYPAIIAEELGWASGYRYPQYPGRGGLPLNIEFLLRDLEHRYGSEINAWESPLALFRLRDLMDDIEDYWERGPGSAPPTPTRAFMHALAVYGWDLRDALERTAASCAALIGVPSDDFIQQSVEHGGERAALRVYPQAPEASQLTLFDTAAALGNDHDESTEAGIETLIIMLGSNDALPCVTNLRVVWSGARYAELAAKGAYTIWQPAHFERELSRVVQRVEQIAARHVVWSTVPHVTIPPVSRGLGAKVRAGSRYFPYYTRPWIDAARFDPQLHPHITGEQARAVDYAIDMFNDFIQTVVARGRAVNRDWYLFDLAGLLDRLAARRYIEDPNARPAWWTPYPIPAGLAHLQPALDSQFLAGDGRGGRARGGLFSLDGVHPTTVAHGIIAQELINIMRTAGVRFYRGDGSERPDPTTVDFSRLIARDTLVTHPPQNVTSSLDILAWADTTVSMFKKAIRF
jgi:lysophospholipase L1-like esterase